MNEELRDDEVRDIREFLRRCDESICENDDFRLEELLNDMSIELIMKPSKFYIFSEWMSERLKMWNSTNYFGMDKILRQFQFNKHNLPTDLRQEVKEFCKAHVRKVSDPNLRQVMAEINEAKE